MDPLYVLKFGGTSLQNASFIQQAVQIISDRRSHARIAVVASAIDGVTDQLVELASNPVDSEAIIDDIQSFHIRLYDELISNPDENYNGLIPLLNELNDVALSKDDSDVSYLAWRDRLLSFGERLSVRLLSAALKEHNIGSTFVDAHHHIRTNALFGEAGVHEDITRENLWASIQLAENVPVVTGFIGSDQAGNITTLGRSGSDYTASLVANALKADKLEIWTDVNGVLTADPKIVPTAETIEALNFDDVAELAEHGLGVLHSKTIQPIRDQDISVQVRNSYDLEHPGTRIDPSITSNGNFKLITVDGPFVYIETAESQASALQLIIEEQTESEQNPFEYSKISGNERAQFLIKESVFEEAQPLLKQWGDKQDEPLTIRRDIYKVKKFTNSLRHDDAPVSELSDLLKHCNIRPLSITRNYKQRYIQLLLTREEAFEAARAINYHPGKRKKSVSLFIAGIGEIGGTLMRQLEELNHPDFEVRLLGYCNSKDVWLQNKKQPTDWNGIIRQLTNSSTSNIIFVDATGSEEVPKLYPRLFEGGIHVVTPSKLANTFGQTFYDKLRKSQFDNDVCFKYETTVGAGLPVISAIRNLQETGDEVTQISGVVSGTMTYIFNQLREGVSFSRAVMKARENSFAEPDPRDDLSGEDVARKFLTLARETGKNIERGELNVSSLIPDELVTADTEAFLSRLPDFDEYWAEKLKSAQKNDASLQYIGHFDGDRITIGLQEVPRQSSLGQLSGTSNFIRISSKIYNEDPLVIQGPGAGKSVTASGVLADILDIAGSLFPSHSSQ